MKATASVQQLKGWLWVMYPPGVRQSCILLLWMGIGLLLNSCGILRPAPKDLPSIDKPSYIRFLTEDSDQALRITFLSALPVDSYLHVYSENDTLQAWLNAQNPLILPAGGQISTTAFPYSSEHQLRKWRLTLRATSYIGNPRTVEPDTQYTYTLPFLPGKTYRIMQGYHGSFSHNKSRSRYAIDFAMPVGDTVCAARGGVVAYFSENSRIGGNHLAYLPYSNNLMIFHDDGTVALYAHLSYQGVLVDLGERVEQGQAIAISGETGFADGAHLHFTLLAPGEQELVSIPLTFSQFSGAELTQMKRITREIQP